MCHANSLYAAQASQCAARRLTHVLCGRAEPHRSDRVTLCCAALCWVQGVVRRDKDFWQSQWRRLKRMMFEVR